MIRINLLPHREERRAGQRRQFGVLAGGVAAIGLLVGLAVHGVISTRIDSQNERNEFLKRAAADLDKEIAEIQRLQGEITSLLSRKQIIETLQSDRARPVILLEALVTQTPDGVYLKSVKQTGQQVQIQGYAQSSARVSMFMRNLQTVDIVESSATSPQLQEIKATTVNNRRLNEFSLNFNLKPAVEPAATTPAGQQNVSRG